MKRILPLLFQNFFYKLLALILAFLIWFLVQQEEREQHPYRDTERMEGVEE